MEEEGGLLDYMSMQLIPSEQFVAASSDPISLAALPMGLTQNCAGCGFDIKDRFLLRVVDQTWHEWCLRCSACGVQLSGAQSCYFRDEKPYCKQDFDQLFGSKCARCQVVLKPSDFVYRIPHSTFHMHCFQCYRCGRPLKKGDHYYLVDGQLLCLDEVATVQTGHQFLAESQHRTSSTRDKKQPKRPRTILNSVQRKAFKYAFEKGPKPSRKVREQLAKETGLSVRVVQVWFQNQRAKMKKEQRKRETGKVVSSVGSNGPNSSTDSEAKSMAGEEEKSTIGSVKSDEDSECDDFLEHRKSPFRPPPAYADSPTRSEQFGSTAINKLYEMQHTYFAFA